VSSGASEAEVSAVQPIGITTTAELGFRLTYLHQNSCRDSYRTFIKAMDRYYDQVEDEKDEDDDFEDIESDAVMLLRLRAERLKSLYLGCLLQ
jgi:hypothetical protein